MAVFVHPTAEVDERAAIGEGTSIWNWTKVREGAAIGASCRIGQGVYIDADVRLGDGCKVQNGYRCAGRDPRALRGETDA